MIWLWRSRSAGARALRAVLAPASAAFGVAAAVRATAYRRGWRETRRLPMPAVAVGNLTAGGTGKTPISAWIADWYARRGVRPAVLLRGYGGDEGVIHRKLVPGAVVVEDPDRVRGAHRAAQLGARVAVLDDAFQRLDVARDVNVVLISADAWDDAVQLLPSGPYREGIRALERADFVAVTRKAAPAEGAMKIAEGLSEVMGRDVAGVAALGISGLHGLMTGVPIGLERLSGASVLAASGIADPAPFVAQLEGLGARVRPARFPDHHRFRARDVTWLLEAGNEVDYVVVTVKDALKLEPLWPGTAREPLVASLDVCWEAGRPQLERLLRACLPDPNTT